MTILSAPPTPTLEVGNGDPLLCPAKFDSSKLTVNTAEKLKLVPDIDLDFIQFGEIKTDYMLEANYDPFTGWSAPEIKPYAPLMLDPACSCLHYSTSVFEGMKAYLGPDGEPRLFRPTMNCERMVRSAERVALPLFDSDELLVLIKKLVLMEARWIPRKPGQSLYIRPTLIGTRPTLGMQSSKYAKLFVIVTPAGYYFAPSPSTPISSPTTFLPASHTPTKSKTVSLLALGGAVRSWPGGAGNHKIGANYAPTFLAQRLAAREGKWSQILWLLGENVTEAGAMNFFVVVKRADGTQGLDVITPPLDGTILPGITRDSCLTLLRAHSDSPLALPALPRSTHIRVYEQSLTMTQLFAWAHKGRLVEAFGVGTAVSVAPVGKIGWKRAEGSENVEVIELVGFGMVATALHERLEEIRTGRAQWDGWCVRCEDVV